jgi:hypothetical protein
VRANRAARQAVAVQPYYAEPVSFPDFYIPAIGSSNLYRIIFIESTCDREIDYYNLITSNIPVLLTKLRYL